MTHSSISGTVDGYKGYYNFYNIGATSSSEPMGAIKKGLEYAKNGTGLSQTTKTKYLIPWNTKEKSITGGAIFIGSSYINVGQNTIYLQKFDVNDDRSSSLFSHQYMTNVLAPYTESNSIYNGYKKAGLLNTAMTFLIPVYDNMPSIPEQNPNINTKNFSDDNTKVYCNASSVNIRTGPSTSYETITTVSKNTKMIRIKKGINSGERWDKVILENGIIGYIYQTYVTKLNVATKITLNQSEVYIEVGDTFEINATIEPENAENKNVTYSSSDDSIVQIDETGKLIGIKKGTAIITVTSSENSNIKEMCTVNVINKVDEIEIHFDSTLKVNNLEIAGIDYSENRVKDIKNKITTNYELEIVNYQNQVLQDDDVIGTGSKIRIKENGEIIKQYQVIVYGDVDGSGKIDSIDLLVLQRHILQIKLLDPIFRKAANIDKTGRKPSSVDLLLIQRHILKLKQIEQ